MSPQQALSAEQQNLNDLWEAHLRAEFEAHSRDEAIKTMVANLLVNLLAVMTGGSGREEVDKILCQTFPEPDRPGFRVRTGLADDRARPRG
jgi:hypothetical protein